MTRVLLVDPSLFTAPYDAALSEGLRANGVIPRWAVRPLRPREEADISDDAVAMHFYRMTDGPRRRRGKAWKLAKGLEHAWDLRRLGRLAASGAFDVVHFQWATLPILDVRAMRRIGRARPVMLTVHDTTPFNGADVSTLQLRSFDDLFDAADHLIVHTEGAREALLTRGVAGERISIIPHGPLALRCTPRTTRDKALGRWRIVLFGRLQAYKGLDVLVEALGRLAPDERDRLEVVVAGDPLMPMDPLLARAAELRLEPPTLQFRLQRLSDQEMADLLGSADALVFPYRAIEASGVLFLVSGMDKWLIASDLGAFSNAIGQGGERGALVPAGDAGALARAIVASIGRRPSAAAPPIVPSWHRIGAQTAALYQHLLRQRG